MMKSTALLFLCALSVVLTVQASSLTYDHLRKSSEHDGAHSELATAESSCNAAKDKSHCFQAVDDATGSPCEWCVAGAIPSECMSSEQASQLPPSVFDCAAPGTRHHTTKKAPRSFTFDSTEVFGYSQTYSLHSKDSSWATSDSDTDDTPPPQPSVSDLCDASSKSLSGYMDIQGSEYDKSGENKHLFYWMFEKRGADMATDDIPVSSNGSLTFRWISRRPLTFLRAMVVGIVCSVADGWTRLFEYIGVVG
jgi:hypothetical protein